MFWVSAIEALQGIIYLIVCAIAAAIYFLLVLSGYFVIEQHVENKTMKYCLFITGGFISFWFFISVLHYATNYYF